MFLPTKLLVYKDKQTMPITVIATTYLNPYPTLDISAEEFLLPVAAGAVPIEVPDLPLAPAEVVLAPELPASLFGDAIAVSVTAPKLQTNVLPLTGAVRLPGKLDKDWVPFAGRSFGLTQGALSVQPGEVKPSVLVQSIESSDAAH